jgi:hypothetical protein
MLTLMRREQILNFIELADEYYRYKVKQVEEDTLNLEDILEIIEVEEE